MTIRTSQSNLKFSEIESEFGRSPNRSIGDYRRSISKGGKTWVLDDGIPTSGTISFSNFLGKQHNIIIVLNGGQTARDKILNDKSSIDSTGYRGTSSSIRKTSKNIVYVNRTIGSAQGSRKKCALRTQDKNSWFGGDPSDGKILIRIGSSGRLYGAGGDGGMGGTEETNGNDGENGTSALGLEVNVESIFIESGGRIQAGGGGGGGGGGAREDSAKLRRAGGGGGGGGAGLPAGQRGDRRKKERQSEGGKGKDGTLNSGGEGGKGGENADEAHGGGGGGGGSFAGGAVDTNTGPGEGGEGGFSKDDGADGGFGSGGNGGAGDDEGHGGAGDSDGGEGGKGGYAITRKSGISQPLLLGQTLSIKGDVGQHGVS